MKDMNDVYAYNDMHQWKYARLVDVFGSKGFEVTTMDELEKVITQLDDIKANLIVHVHVPKVDIPESIAYKNTKPGEDEILNPKWSLCG